MALAELMTWRTETDSSVNQCTCSDVIEVSFDLRFPVAEVAGEWLP
jgi:hypothetical protein